MNCTCKADIEAKLLDAFKAEVPTAVDHSVELKGYLFAIEGNTMVIRPSTTVERFAKVPAKSGGTKSKRSTLNMVFSFCPFCGAKVGAQ